MRIVSGKYRRRQLLTNPGDTTRPITDRAKVKLFDRLQPTLDTGPRVADIFAGTGSMGLESLSRGAHSVVFFEQDSTAHDLLRQNVAMVGAEDDTVCWKTDVFRTSFRPKGCPDFLPYDLVFFDPPYKLAARIQPGSLLYASLERLAKPTLCAPGALLIFRCDEHSEFTLPPVWEFEQEHIVGRMKIQFLRFQPDAGVELPTDDEAEANADVSAGDVELTADSLPQDTDESD